MAMLNPSMERERRSELSKDENSGQLLRFLVVGACGYLLAVTLYAIEIAVGISAYAAVPPVFVANGLFNFFLNRHWSFPGSGQPLSTELARFAVIAVGSLWPTTRPCTSFTAWPGSRRCPLRRAPS